MAYLELLLDHPSLSPARLFQEPPSVLSLFRKLTPLSRLFLLRSLNINSHTQSIPVKLFKDKWSLQNGHELFFSEVTKYQIAKVQPNLSPNNDQLTFNSHFTSSLLLIQNQGIIFKLVHLHGPPLDHSQLDSIQKWSYAQWQNIHECIVCLYNKLASKKMSNLVSLLKTNKLINTNNNQISKAGFEFILSSTAAQISRLLYLYSLHMAHKYPLEQIVSTILELNLLPSHQPFSPIGSPLMTELVSDFCSIGLMHQIPGSSYYVTTRLLQHFSFEQLSVNIQFKFNLIIETNFKIYVYSINDFIVRLLENFCEIEYKMPGFIVGEMKRANVMRLYSNEIRSDQLIEFLSQNVDRDKLRQITQKKQDNYNHLYNSTNKAELEYLQIYRRTQTNLGIPDNVAQQLHLWHSEQNVAFSKTALDDELAQDMFQDEEEDEEEPG